MNNKVFKDTASQLLGISDDWSIMDIKEHLVWLVNNPNEIADGYDKSLINEESIDDIMEWVKYIKQQM